MPPIDPINALKCELAGETLRSSRRLRLQVMGWSMLPAVMPGDVLIVERVEPKNLSTGDIVLFERDRRLFAHRVIAGVFDHTDGRIVTKGDAMLRPDVPVSESELLGKVSSIVRHGKMLEPNRRPGAVHRAIAAMVRRSRSAAKIVVGVHGMLGRPPEPAVTCQN
jgi:signal peptidase I